LRTQSYKRRFEVCGGCGGGYLVGGTLTLFESHACIALVVEGLLEENGVRTRPSKMPSPVVAQLGSTFQTWSFAMLLSFSFSDTSFGRMAAMY